MYPNYPGQQQYPGQPFGAGYPPMPQPGMPQQPGYPAMPMQGMPQPMGQPGYPQMAQPNYPPMGQPGYPPMGQPGFQAAPQSTYGYPPQGQPSYPTQQQQPPMSSNDPYGQQGAMYPNQGSYQQQQSPQQPQYPTASPTIQAHQYSSQFSATSNNSMSTHIQHQQQTGRPTRTPVPNFNATNDAAVLRKAMKGFGTDEDALINVLCRRSTAQNLEIARAFKTCYGKDLISDIKSEVSGNFEILLVALLTETTEYYCKEIYNAISGAGTDEDVLIETMCGMQPHEIRNIGMKYQSIFGKSLEDELRSDTSGHFKRLMVSLSTGNRDPTTTTDINSARQDAQELMNAGINQMGTDESTFNRILCQRNHQQLKLICQEYQKLTGRSLETDIKREFSGDIENGLIAILQYANNPTEFYARRLHRSMAGAGTDDNALIRIVVTRSEIDMADIKDIFHTLFGNSLKSFIKGDTSGDYKHALYALIGENRS